MNNTQDAVQALIRAGQCNSAQQLEAERLTIKAVALAIMAQTEVLERIVATLQDRSPKLAGVRDTLDGVIRDLHNPHYRHGCTGIPNGVDTAWVEASIRTLESLRGGL